MRSRRFPTPYSSSPDLLPLHLNTKFSIPLINSYRFENRPTFLSSCSSIKMINGRKADLLQSSHSTQDTFIKQEYHRSVETWVSHEDFDQDYIGTRKACTFVEKPVCNGANGVGLPKDFGSSAMFFKYF